MNSEVAYKDKFRLEFYREKYRRKSSYKYLILL